MVHRDANRRGAKHFVLFTILLAAAVAGSAPTARSEPSEPVAPGLNELVVIPPGAHERGLPAVNLEPSNGGSRVQVDIPPTIHVHRYYYNGDREYQGPILQGGPTVVVANHPKTGQRLYINVSLPPGTPRIAYNKSGINYIYPDRRVSVRWGKWHKDVASVHYHGGQGAKRNASAAMQHVASGTRGVLGRSRAPQSVHETLSGGGKLLVGTAASVDSMTGGLLDRTKSVFSSIPILGQLGGQADEAPKRSYDTRMRRAGKQRDALETKFVPTNR